MNNVPPPPIYQLKHSANSTDTIKVFIAGNSITTHSIAKQIGWDYRSGMAATSVHKDYVHLFFYGLKNSTSKNILLRYSNYADFERSPDVHFSKLDAIKSFDPDVLIIQLGDNTPEDQSEDFKEKIVSLISNLPKTKTYIVSPFFQNTTNLKINQQIASASNSTFIRTNLSSDDLTYNSKSNPDDDWKSPGISAHPNNSAMLALSNILLKATSPTH